VKGYRERASRRMNFLNGYAPRDDAHTSSIESAIWTRCASERQRSSVLLGEG
jgi:hypothetical protein